MHPIQKFILQYVSSHPTKVVKVAMEQFNVTRAAVLFHLNKLKASGLIVQTGSRTKTSYRLRSVVAGVDQSKSYEHAYKIDGRGEDEVWRSDIAGHLKDLPVNVVDICKYGFTEMFNNVIDHSESKNALVRIERTPEVVKIAVIDFGIGVFKKVAVHFRFEDVRDAVVKIHQGKVTTDTKRHTGQGIFFTSRAFDHFIIFANGFMYLKENSQRDEWYWERSENMEKGTHVEMRISTKSEKKLKDVFDDYTNKDDEDHHFDKSHIRVELAAYEEDTFISRSQAKRVLHGLTDFNTLILDFKNIRNVGQAFVDEVFGVYGLEHTNVNFVVVNANEDVIFMIKRGMKDRNFPMGRVSLNN